MKPRLLAISYRFPPDPYPLCSRVKTVLSGLAEDYEIHAITSSPNPDSSFAKIHRVPSNVRYGLYNRTDRLRLRRWEKFFVVPDRQRSWIRPATSKSLTLIQELDPDVVLAFAMPFSDGVVATNIARSTKVPVVLNLNDSPSCSDMWPERPTRWHYHYALKLERSFATDTQAVIYLSKFNMDAAKGRVDPKHHSKFHLIRKSTFGSSAPSTSRDDGIYRILYTGTMVGWSSFVSRSPAKAMLSDLWAHAGTYKLVEIDFRSHSPIFIGEAIKQIITESPELSGKIELHIIGKNGPEALVKRVLQEAGLHDIVKVRPPVGKSELLEEMGSADLLFLALPDRKDGTPGGRIAAKTYDYLSTDKPIIAALPTGENRDFVSDKPGVFLVDPLDSTSMKRILSQLVQSKMAGQDQTFDRSAIREELRPDKMVSAFKLVLRDAISNSSASR